MTKIAVFENQTVDAVSANVSANAVPSPVDVDPLTQLAAWGLTRIEDTTSTTV